MMINEYEQPSVLFSDDSFALVAHERSYKVCLNALPSLSARQRLDLGTQFLLAGLKALQEEGQDWTAIGFVLEGAAPATVQMMDLFRSASRASQILGLPSRDSL